MFDLKKPCANCPFRKGAGKFFGLSKSRLEDIFTADAFECHKTTGVSGKKHPPQQCAGLMSILYKSGRPNTIMQVASRITDYDPANIDHSETYDSLDDCIAEHNRLGDITD